MTGQGGSLSIFGPRVESTQARPSFHQPGVQYTSVPRRQSRACTHSARCRARCSPTNSSSMRRADATCALQMPPTAVQDSIYQSSAFANYAPEKSPLDSKAGPLARSEMAHRNGEQQRLPSADPVQASQGLVGQSCQTGTPRAHHVCPLPLAPADVQQQREMRPTASTVVTDQNARHGPGGDQFGALYEQASVESGSTQLRSHHPGITGLSPSAPQ